MEEIKLNISRPLIFFDLETTGTSVTTDRIVELSYLKVYPNGEKESKTRRLNPEMHIPEASTRVHHITDDDVKDCPTFRQIAKSLMDIFEGCDVAGYNSNKFDVPLLIEEFARVGMAFDIKNRRFIDVQSIFYRMEPRTLVAAYKKFCGKNLEDAHSAMADTMATYEVLLGQIREYEDLENDIESLAKYSENENNVDMVGRIVRDEEGNCLINFGKHKGRKVEEIFATDHGYYSWIMNGDFPKNTKDVLTGLYMKYLEQRKKKKSK